MHRGYHGWTTMDNRADGKLHAHILTTFHDADRLRRDLEAENIFQHVENGSLADLGDGYEAIFPLEHAGVIKAALDRIAC